MRRTMDGSAEPTGLDQLRKLEEDDQRPPANPPPPEGFDSWAEFYEWERSSDTPA
jgi:hypothetical protein